MGTALTSVDLADHAYQAGLESREKKQLLAESEAREIWGSPNHHDLIYPVKNNICIDAGFVKALKQVREYIAKNKLDDEIHKPLNIIIATAEEAVVADVLENME